MDERIKELRKVLNLTQEEFANKIGVIRNSITQYETGRSNIPVPTLKLICREFNVSEKWLRDGEGEMFLPEEKSEFYAFAKKNSLSDAERIFLEKYLKLNDKQRDAVFKFLLSVSEEIQKNTLAEEKELSIDEKVELYRQSLAEEEKEKIELYRKELELEENSGKKFEA